MKHHLDVSSKELVVTKAPVPRMDKEGQEQRLDNMTGLPQWETEVLVTEVTGSTVIRIITSSEEPPKVDRGQEIIADGLSVYPWAVKRGVVFFTYYAEDITVRED